MEKQGFPTGCLQAIQRIQADPLENLRKLVRAKHGVGLYLAPLPIELSAFECYLDEETFWEKYDGPIEKTEVNTDLLLSFESTIYQGNIRI